MTSFLNEKRKASLVQYRSMGWAKYARISSFKNDIVTIS